MNICTNFTCLLAGVIAIVVAIAIFYLIGLFITRNNNRKNNKPVDLMDKDYRANRPNRLNDEQSKLKTKPKDEIYETDEDEVM